MITLIDIKARDFHKRLVSGDATIYGEDDEPLLMEWKDVTMTTTDVVLIGLENKIQWCAAYMDVTNAIIAVLLENYNQKWADQLIALYPTVTITEENYLEAIENVRRQSGNFLYQYNDAKRERDRIYGTSGDKPTMKYYAKITNAISKTQGFSVHPDINALEWADLYVQLIEQSEKVENHAGRQIG